MAQYESMAAFARRVKTTPGEVTRAVRQGLPRTKNGFIPIAPGEAWWEANRQARINSAGRGPIAIQSYAKSRADKMVHEAKRSKTDAERSELELAVRRGELVEVAAMRKAWFGLVQMTRDRMQAIPERVAAQMAVERDPGRVRKHLADEIALALEALISKLSHGTGEEK